MIHVMAAIGLRGTAMSAPVVGYHAIVVIEEEQHLSVPIIGRQRPTVAEYNRLPFTPVLVVDLRAVFRRDRSHGMFSFLTFVLGSSLSIAPSKITLPKPF